MEGVEGLSTAVGMTLGAGKCAVAHLRAGRLRQRGGVEFQGDDIEEISGSTYRYLGIEQMIGTRSRETKDKVVREYLQRVQIVWSSPLSAGAKVRAHNSWAVAVLRYRMAPLVWGRRELHKLDVDTRALMVKNKAHELSSDCDRLYLPRKEGGRGLIGVEKTWEREVVSADCYLKTCSDPQVKEAVQGMRRLENQLVQTPISRAREILAEYEVPTYVLAWVGADPEAPGAGACQKLLKARQQESLRERHESKVVHGVYAKQGN